MKMKLPLAIKNISSIVQGNIVGGAVRDHFLGRDIYDYDISTPMLPEAVIEILKENGYTPILTGVKYGTVSVNVRGMKTPVEITTYRSEFYSKEKGRFPDVAFHINRNNDLMRRDFTINSIAYDPRTGQFIDPNNGIADIQNRIIRFVGNGSERIREDPLRSIRACRIASNLSFTIDEGTSASIISNAYLLSTLSQDRLVMEIRKSGIHRSFLQNLMAHGLMEYVFGHNFNTTTTTFHDSRGSHHGESVWQHTLNAMDRCNYITSTDLALKLAVLFHDTGKPSTRTSNNGKIQFLNHEAISASIFMASVGSYAGLEKGIKREVEFLIQNHMLFPQLTTNRSIIRHTIEWKMAGIPYPVLHNLGKLAFCDRGISFGNILSKMEKVWIVDRPDGNLFLKYPERNRKEMIRQAWIDKVHQEGVLQ